MNLHFLTALFALVVAVASDLIPHARATGGTTPAIIDLVLSESSSNSSSGGGTTPDTNQTQFAINESNRSFASSASEQSLIDAGVARIEIGEQRIYIGTQQVTAINQDPIIKSFGGANNWARTDYETTGTDGRGVALFYTGERLYASFSVDGTQGTPAQDFRRATSLEQPSWFRSYGQGGGARIAVLSEIDPSNGDLLRAAHISALLSNGNSNTLRLERLELNNAQNLVMVASSFFSPRAPNGSALARQTTNASPFIYRLELSPDLLEALSAESPDF